MTGITGQRLGNYRLVRLLGRGGFAEVYLGEHVRLGTQSAIKLLATHLSDTEAEKFLAEARTIARLEHPHIIRILDFDIEQDIPFLVMSYAPNGTLRQRYPKGTRPRLDVVLSYLKQAAAALQYAHDEKLIHRDIKPENMLIGRHNELLLSDFGIAVVAHSSHSQSTQEIMGTLSYMAPEQILGKPRPSSDQYALGVIVYEWLCGNHPFQGTAAEISSQHLHAEPPSLCEQVPGMPHALEAVVLKALEKDPHRRFASVQEFAVALEQACQVVLPAMALFANHSSAMSSAISTTPGQAAFYASPTLVDVMVQPPKEGKHRIPRRALLSGTIGIVGLTAIGGGLLWLARQQKLPLGITLVTYMGHLNTVTSVAWSPDGARIASGSWDQTVQVWGATSGTHSLIYHGHTTNVNAVAWSPLHTGQRIASASGNNFFKGDFVVLVWKPTTGGHLLTYSGHTQPVHTACWSPDGKRIASGGEDKTVQIWEASNGSPLLSYIRHTDMISAVAWSPDGRHIASASNDFTVQVWDAHIGTPIFTCNHSSTVNAVAWSPDGRRIASASGNVFFGSGFNVQIWDAATGIHLFTYHGHTAPVSTLAWSPDGKRIASASSSLEKTVKIWDATSGATLFTYRGHTLGVNALAWSPDGTLIASGSLDGTVRVWSAS